MNLLEKRMVDVLKDLRDNHGTVGLKAEFEAEGTRIEEALRLKEVCMAAGLGLTIKIGGCEALRDMYECRTIGVNRIVAPMVESAFALHKYLAATKLAYPAQERQEMPFAINIETGLSCKNFDEMLALPEIGQLHGIVLGRVDLTGSMGIARNDVDCPVILNIAREVFTKAKRLGMECCVGGGVSAHSIPFFRELGPLLDKYETRKVVFACAEALPRQPEQGILRAVGFELMWLKNKRDYYSLISNEDNQRLTMLESRYKTSIEAAGGRYE